MNPHLKFQQRWEYRKKDDDVDSSSDDSRSKSGYEPGQKRVLSDLVLLQEDEESATPRSQYSDQFNMTGNPLQIVEANNMHCGPGKRKRAAANRSKGNSVKKRKEELEVKHTEESAQLADLKTFTESLLKEFKAARNAMLSRFKKQIRTLTTAKPTSRTKRKEGTDKSIHQNENGSGRTRNCKSRPRKSKTQLGSSKCLKATEKRENHEQATAANEMEKRENLSSPKEKPMIESAQMVSSSCLTLPSIPSKPQTDSLRTEFSSSDLTHAGCAMNRTNIFERPNFLTDEQSRHGYLPNDLPDEQFESFSQMSSKSMGFFDQQSNQTPNIHPCIRVPVNQWPDDCFSITSQIVLETPVQEDSSVCLRMNTGGIKFPGRAYAL